MEIWLRGKKGCNILFLHEKLSQHAKLRTIWKRNINEEGQWKHNYNNWPRNNNRIYEEQHKRRGPGRTQTPISHSAWVWELERRFPHMDSHSTSQKDGVEFMHVPRLMDDRVFEIAQVCWYQKKPQTKPKDKQTNKKSKENKCFTGKCPGAFPESKFLLQEFKWQ